MTPVIGAAGLIMTVVAGVRLTVTWVLASWPDGHEVPALPGQVKLLLSAATWAQ